MQTTVLQGCYDSASGPSMSRRIKQGATDTVMRIIAGLQLTQLDVQS